MKSKKGFTLIELMVVMAIIAVLSVLIIAAINIARQSSRNTTRQADAKTFQAALEAFFGANRNYPGTVNTSSDVYVTTSNVRSVATFQTYLPTTQLAADPNGSTNRLIYCPLSATTYMLYVVNEPNTANVPGANCNGGAAPTGATDFSVR
jgi:prepilin-type N-terminal cleavage/methylation domain-containing protein